MCLSGCPLPCFGRTCKTMFKQMSARVGLQAFVAGCAGHPDRFHQDCGSCGDLRGSASCVAVQPCCRAPLVCHGAWGWASLLLLVWGWVFHVLEMPCCPPRASLKLLRCNFGNGPRGPGDRQQVRCQSGCGQQCGGWGSGEWELLLSAWTRQLGATGCACPEQAVTGIKDYLNLGQDFGSTSFTLVKSLKIACWQLRVKGLNLFSWLIWYR